MTSRLHLVAELLYGTGLLTVITAAPEIMIKLRLNPIQVSTVSFSYPGLGVYMIEVLLLTALVMLPSVVTLPNFLTRRLRCHFLALLPWILTCCRQFLLNITKHVFAISQVARFNSPKVPIMALVMYCLIFGMASVLILHWIATCHLRTDGMPFVVSRKL